MSEAKRRTWALLAIVFLALLAAADGLYLTVVHVDYEFGRPGLNAVCHALSARGCSVTAGRFGDMAGVPVSVIGFAGALAVSASALAALRGRMRNEDPARSVLFVLTGFSVLVSVVMAIFSLVEGSFCPFCLLWYALNAGMFAAAWMLRAPELGPRDLLDDMLGGAGAIAIGAFSASLVFGMWFHERERKAAFEEFEAVKAAIVDQILAEGPPRDIELPDAPRKGPADADVVLVEFGDFECPFCRRLWNTIEAYLEKTEHRVQVVFAHFPLDSDCNPHAGKVHPGACEAAAAARCAQRQERFWDYGQALFDHQPAFERAELVGYARELGLDVQAFEGCLDDPSVLEEIRADIERGRQLGVEATPTFFVNGHIHEGGTNALILDALVDRLASEAEASKSSSVAVR